MARVMNSFGVMVMVRAGIRVYVALTKALSLAASSAARDRGENYVSTAWWKCLNVFVI